MRTESTQLGIKYHFENGYTMTVVKTQGLLPTDSRIYECDIADNEHSLVSLAHQTEEEIEQIKTMFESNNTDMIEEFLGFYPEDYCDPDYDGWGSSYPDYMEESRERVPILQKEVQEIQAELDEQLRLLGDNAIPSIIISVTRYGSGLDDDTFYIKSISVDCRDGQIIKDCTQETSRCHSEMVYECAEETEIIDQLRPLRLHLKLAKAGYKVISSYYL